jgi:hypothetical protein
MGLVKGYYKFNCTLLDSFVNYLGEEDGDLDRFISGIVSPEESLGMRLGSLFHGLLQDRRSECVDGYYGYRDSRYGLEGELPCDLVDSSRLLFDSRLREVSMGLYPSVLPCWEVRGELWFEVDGVRLCLVGKADGILGSILEVKTTRNYSFDKYYRSLQWGCYMELFDIDRVDYFVYELGCRGGEEDLSGYYVKDFHSFYFVRDEGFRSRLEVYLMRFYDFVESYGLGEYFVKYE